MRERREFTISRLRELTERVESLDSLRAIDRLTIYATGSYGRGEASAQSDIDLFFVEPEHSVSAIDKTLLDADLIYATRKMGFQEFSGDGRYLEIHSLESFRDKLGSPADDFENLFT